MTINDDPVTRCHTICNDRNALVDVADRYRADLDRIVGLDAIDIVAVLPALHRFGGDDRSGRHGRDLHSCVDEFARPQSTVRVVEQRLELHMSRARVYLAIDEDQLASGERPFAAPRVGNDDRVTSGHRRQNFRQLVLRDSEQHRDRLHLGDRHEAVCVRGMNHGPRIDEPQPGAAA